MNEKEVVPTKDPLAHDEFVTEPAPTKAEERRPSGHAAALNIVVNPLKVSSTKLDTKTDLVTQHQKAILTIYFYSALS
jgi:hypothetical protein